MPAERKWLLQEPEGMFNRSSKSSEVLSKLRTHVLSGAGAFGAFFFFQGFLLDIAL